MAINLAHGAHWSRVESSIVSNIFSDNRFGRDSVIRYRRISVVQISTTTVKSVAKGEVSNALLNTVLSSSAVKPRPSRAWISGVSHGRLILAVP